MIVLSDNDIILKLASCDLLEAFVGLFGGNKKVFRCLPTALYAIQKSKGISLRYGGVAIERAVTFCKSLEEIPTSDKQDFFEVLDVLTNLEGMDEEAYFFAIATVLEEKIYIATDDKRSLQAMLKHSKECALILRGIQGRVLTFLTVLDLMIKRFGIDFVFEKVYPNRICDQGARAVFSQKSSVQEALRSYLQSDQNEYNGLIGYGVSLNALLSE